MASQARNPVAGFFLALVAAAMWGWLPVTLKELLVGMDAQTIVWYRFLVAAAVLLPWMVWLGRLPAPRQFRGATGWWLLLAAVGLSSNYYLFSVSLNFVNGETAETVIQLTTLFLIFGGVVFYKEPFTMAQKLGTALIVVGLVLFFHDRLAEIVDPENAQTIGVLIVVASAIGWTTYALLQKKLNSEFTSAQILLAIYVFSTLILLPFINPGSLFDLSGLQYGLLAFACLNTLVAYGCFAEALKLWDASQGQRGACPGAAVHDRLAETGGLDQSRLRIFRPAELDFHRRRHGAGHRFRANGHRAQDQGRRAPAACNHPPRGLDPG